MKKISILFYLVLSLFTYLSCEQQDEINSLNSTDSQIAIDKNSQINLESTTLTNKQIVNNSCGELFTTTLFAGQHINVGTLTIANDKTNLYITYTVIGNWWLSETHLFAGSKENLPLNGGGNPKIGHFPYHGKHDLVKSYSFTIPLNQLDECFVVSAHAVVVKKENGEITTSETAFAKGKDENVFGSRWGWYIDNCEEECTDNDDTVEECLNTFAYNVTDTDRSYCFTYSDSNSKSITGWSNEFNFYEQQNNHYTLPLYAKVDNCNIDPTTDANTIEIGYVDLYLFSEGVGDGMTLFTTIKYVIYTSYELSDVNLHLSTVKNPNNLDPSKGYSYSSSSDYWNSNTNSFENLPWPGNYNAWDTYFIPHVIVCTK